MNNRVSKYDVIIVKCNTDKELCYIQEYLFQNGYQWSSGSNTFYYHIIGNCYYIKLHRNKKLTKISASYINLEEYISGESYYCNNIKELKSLFDRPDYNSPKILVYD